MHGPRIGIQRSQSECLILGPKIISPSPVNRKASRISTVVAQELYASVPPRIEEFEVEADDAFIPRFFKAKSCIFQSGSDSSK